MTNISFNRSTHLARDTSNPEQIQGIILTASLKKTLTTIKDNILAEGNDNAFAIVGPYGSGKSTTALLMHQYLTGSVNVTFQKKLTSAGLTPLPNHANYDKTFVLVGDNISLNDSLKDVFGYMKMKLKKK